MSDVRKFWRGFITRFYFIDIRILIAGYMNPGSNYFLKNKPLEGI